MVFHFFLLLIAVLNVHTAPPMGNEENGNKNEKETFCTRSTFRLVDLAFNSVALPAPGIENQLELEHDKITFSGGVNTCPIHINSSSDIKSMAQFHLGLDWCKTRMTLTNLAKMELTIKYNDAHEEEKELRIPMSHLPEETREQICTPEPDTVVRVEVVPNQTTPKVTPVKSAFRSGWLEIEVVEHNQDGGIHTTASMPLHGFSVRKFGFGAGDCHPYSSGHNRFTVKWADCPNWVMDAEHLRNVEIKVELENGKYMEKRETTISIPLADLPYEELEKLYEGGKAHIIFKNAKIAQIVRVSQPEPASSEESDEEEICQPHPSSNIFRLIDLEFNMGSNPESRLKLEPHKVTLSDGHNSCRTHIDANYKHIKASAQIELGLDDCTTKMTLKKFAKMELTIKYSDAHGVEKEQRIPMSRLPAETREDICNGLSEVVHLDVVPNQSVPKITPLKYRGPNLKKIQLESPEKSDKNAKILHVKKPVVAKPME